MTVSHPNYEDYPCLISNPLQCDRPQQTVGEVEKAKFCMDCGFPTTLALRRDLKGRVGTYRVQQWLGTRGWGRLYLGQRAVDSQPVLIKEYLLPRRSFTADEAHRRQETFLRVAGIRPIDERNQDFRLMPVLDTFADRPSQEEKQLIYRCYLISADLRNSDGQRSLTLREYLKQRGIMTLVQVRECLQQTLQTLYFLHHQQLRFPSGQICQGIAHGNLTLDSLILREVENRFYIYFCDRSNPTVLYWTTWVSSTASNKPSPSIARKSTPSSKISNSSKFSSKLTWRNKPPLTCNSLPKTSTTKIDRS